MPPQRFASVRAAPRHTTIVTFRDDIGMRYEETKQADLPIPIPPPRNPARVSRQYPTSTTTVASPTPAFSTTATTTIPALAPMTPPPTRPLPPAPLALRPTRPPQLQHPVLRGEPSPPISNEETWKRDSGHGGTASSSTTCRDEFQQDDLAYDKFADDEVTSIYSTDLPAPTPTSPIRPNDSPGATGRRSPAKPVSLRISTINLPPPPMQSVFTDTPDLTPTSDDGNPWDLILRSRNAGHSRSASLPKKLGKTFSVKSSGTKLRKKNLSESGITASPVRAETPSIKAPSVTAVGSMVYFLTPLQSRGNRSSFQAPKMAAASGPPELALAPPPRPPTPEPLRLDDIDASPDFDFGPTSPPPPRPPFSPITTRIPNNRLMDEKFLAHMIFSDHGSMIIPEEPEPVEECDAPVIRFSFEEFAGTSVIPVAAPEADSSRDSEDTVYEARSSSGSSQGRPSMQGQDPPTPPMPSPAPTAMSPPEIRVVSVDVSRESQKVRSLYEPDDSLHWQDGSGRVVSSAAGGEHLAPTAEVPSDGEDNAVASSRLGSGLSISPATTTSRPGSSSSQPPDSSTRRETELAGGIEDWEDVNGADVDRYGFIHERPRDGRSSALSTQAQQAQTEPRKRNVLVKRPPGAPRPSSSAQLDPRRTPTRKVSARSLNTQTSGLSTGSKRSTRSSVRAAANLLPYNRERRWMDEAGEMLCMSPGLADIAEDEEGERLTEALKRKEWDRCEKWRKMAKVVRKGKDGQGMDFDFDAKHPKIVERTWKGIPDMWRAAAWYSFLAQHASNADDKATEEQLMAEFHRLQDSECADDVQIDLDVPRTINRHIMFRRRYRGGQRLLFRVLHALSLYFPGTGYVQGMASLAATLLCYFDEEKCFVMMVRMWRYRGLEQLYQPGFDGLMAALKDFESSWLGGKDIARKLLDLSIDGTAYGTRWYLTLFNLTIPFPAQLRVWDIFMLLGDSTSPERVTRRPPLGPAEGSSNSSSSAAQTPVPPLNLDVLHATSAALIEALREVLLDSDFENAMKALTSWIPIKDEDLLMKVVLAEWKQHRARKERARV